MVDTVSQYVSFPASVTLLGVDVDTGAVAEASDPARNAAKAAVTVLGDAVQTLKDAIGAETVAVPVPESFPGARAWTLTTYADADTRRCENRGGLGVPFRKDFLSRGDAFTNESQTYFIPLRTRLFHSSLFTLHSSFAPGSNLSSGGTRASSPVSAASATMAPSTPWYTSPRAPRPPTYHQFFFSLSTPRRFPCASGPSARRARPAAATPGSTSACSRGRRNAPRPRATPAARAKPARRRRAGHELARAAAEARGRGDAPASASGISPARRASATDAPYSLVVPTSTRSGACWACAATSRTAGAPSGQPPSRRCRAPLLDDGCCCRRCGAEGRLRAHAPIRRRRRTR